NTESTSVAGSPRKNAKAVNATSTTASAYLSRAGGERIALPVISASVASAITSTPGITGSTGVGLASLRPDAVYPTRTTPSCSARRALVASRQIGRLPPSRSAALILGSRESSRQLGRTVGASVSGGTD